MNSRADTLYSSDEFSEYASPYIDDTSTLNGRTNWKKVFDNPLPFFVLGIVVMLIIGVITLAISGIYFKVTSPEKQNFSNKKNETLEKQIESLNKMQRINLTL